MHMSTHRPIHVSTHMSALLPIGMRANVCAHACALGCKCVYGHVYTQAEQREAQLAELRAEVAAMSTHMSIHMSVHTFVHEHVCPQTFSQVSTHMFFCFVFTSSVAVSIQPRRHHQKQKKRPHTCLHTCVFMYTHMSAPLSIDMRGHVRTRGCTPIYSHACAQAEQRESQMAELRAEVAPMSTRMSKHMSVRAFVHGHALRIYHLSLCTSSLRARPPACLSQVAAGSANWWSPPKKRGAHPTGGAARGNQGPTTRLAC